MVLAFAAFAFAQSSSEIDSNDTTTVTEFFAGCSTLPVGNGSTTVDALTTYTTVYEETCSTGLAPVTYTITEPCSETSRNRPTNHIPKGFVVTTIACAPCQASVTLTTPLKIQTPAPSPTINPIPVNTSTVCHTCNQTVPSVQLGHAATVSLGLSFVTFFAFIAGALILL